MKDKSLIITKTGVHYLYQGPTQAKALERALKDIGTENIDVIWGTDMRTKYGATQEYLMALEREATS